MAPIVDLNWLAIIVAVIAAFAVGSVWYGVLFAKPWQTAMGFTGSSAPNSSDMVRGSIINIIGTIITAIALAYLIGEYRPSAWGATGEEASPLLYGLYGGFFPWLGFVVPILLTGVAYERKSWTLFLINAGAQLAMFLVMALILAFWR